MSVLLGKLEISASVKTVTFLSFSTLILALSNMISGIVVMNWLSPKEVGLWNSLYIAIYYVSFLQLGIPNALHRELPFYFGKGDKDYAIDLVRTTQWHSQILSFLLFFITVLLGAIFLFFKTFNAIEIFSFVNLGLVISMQIFINFLTVTYRANKSFHSLSIINLVQSCIILISLFLVYEYNYVGYVLRFVIIGISLLLMMFLRRPFKVRSKFHVDYYKYLLKIGIPLYTLLFLLGITETFNRVVLLKVSNYEAVGIYYPSIAIITAMKVIPGAISQFLYPKMSYEVGKTNDLNKIWGWIWKVVALIFIIMLPIAFVGYLILPDLFNEYFPNYIDGLFAARIALFSGLLAGSTIIINVFASLKSWFELSILAILKVSLYFLLPYYFAGKINPIDGVAVGTLTADLIFFVILFILTYYVLILKRRDHFLYKNYSS